MTPPFFRLPARTEFYLVRHGESESNRDGYIQGHSESALSPEGIRHARAAGRWLAGRSIDLVLTSPLLRTRQTAEAIATAAGLTEAEVVDELIELDTGVLSGVRIADLASTDPELYRSFRVHSWEAVPEAERIASLERRADAVWALLVDRAASGHRSVVCVTHGGMIQWLIKATIGTQGQRWMPLFEASNCGIFHFSAESTLDAPATGHAAGGSVPEDSVPEGSVPEPGTGYYGIWRLMNHRPYE